MDPVQWRNAKRIGALGAALGLLWATGLVILALYQPDPYAGVWMLVLEMAFTGRAVNIAHGVRDAYHPAVLLFQAGLQDIVLILCAWPLIVLGEAAAERIPVVGGVVRGWHDSARRHQDWADRFGVLGLIAFVFFPFWSTGVLVGGALGHLMGMRTLPVLLTCILAHLASVASLLWAFDRVAAVSGVLEHGVMAYLPWLVLGLLASVWGLGKLIGWLRKRQPAAP